MGVRVPGRIARGELPTEPYGTHRGHPGHRLVGVDGRPIPPPAQHPRRTQDNPSSPQRWGRSSSNGSQPMINRRSSHKAQTSALGVSDKSLNTDPIPKYRRKDARGKTDMSATAKEPRKPYVPAMGHDRLLPLYDPLQRLLGMGSLHRQLVDQARIQPEQRVLEIGCGTGNLVILIKRLHPRAEVVGIDPDPKALARAAKGRAGGALHATGSRVRGGASLPGRIFRPGAIRLDVPPPRAGGEREVAG